MTMSTSGREHVFSYRKVAVSFETGSGESPEILSVSVTFEQTKYIN